MELVLLFGTSLAVGFSGAVTPGPLLMVNIAEVAKRGFWAGPGVALGHSLLELVTVILLVLGLGPLLSQGIVPGMVGLLGGLFLLWISSKMFRSVRTLSLADQVAAARGESRSGPIIAGVTASISNPYWLIWWATVGAAFLSTSMTWGLLGVAAFYLGHITADFTWYSFVAAIVAAGRRALSDVVYRGLIVSCALFLLALSGYFMLSGVAVLLGYQPFSS